MANNAALIFLPPLISPNCHHRESLKFQSGLSTHTVKINQEATRIATFLVIIIIVYDQLLYAAVHP